MPIEWKHWSKQRTRKREIALRAYGVVQCHHSGNANEYGRK